MSKLLKKYNELKSKDNNKIYIFKVGIFYNIFNKDADIVSKALGLKITQLSDSLYKVGFPVSKIDKYTQLLKNNQLNFQIVDDNIKIHSNDEYVKVIATNEIVKKILDIDFNNTTFIEAFNLLRTIQNELKKTYEK